jgi:hypothetical protein
VQRLRAKLEVAKVDVRISAVRGYGFRADVDRSTDVIQLSRASRG